MKRKGIIADDQFSLCFGNDGGHLHFGGYNPSLNNQNEPINISMTINHGYFIEITDIKVIYIYIYIDCIYIYRLERTQY